MTRAYVSRLCLDRIDRGWSGEPLAEPVLGALLWADIAGFTAIAERFSNEGAAGAERLSETLNAYHAEMLAIIDRFGGDLQFVAGDGAMILWRAESRRHLGRATASARAAANALVARVTASAAFKSRFVVTAGELTSFLVGGEDPWLHLLAGDAVRQISATPALPGETLILSAEAAAAAASAYEEVKAAPPAERATTTGSADRFLPPRLVASLRSGRSGFVAEFRTVTTVFVDLRALGFSPELAPLEKTVATLRRVLRDHGGALYQFVQDDKGTYAIAVFGLAGSAHDDDPVRGVRFARALRRQLEPLLGAVGCGVATGGVFCGECGGPTRRQYALFGTAVNRGARLMSITDEVLIDAATFQQAERKLLFDQSVAVRVKGLGELVAYRGGEPRGAPALDRSFFGRRAEQERFRARLAAFRDGAPGGVIVTEGPPGIGKTALLGQVVRFGRELGLEVAFATSDPFERRTPYFSLREVVRSLLRLEPGSTIDDTQRILEARLQALGRDPQLAPLLGPFLGHGLPDTELTKQMTGAMRAENGNALIVALLSAATEAKRWIAIVDDVHWLDNASGELLPRIIAELPRVEWVLSCRPDEAPAQMAKIAAAGERWPLAGLGGDEVALLLEETWGVSTVSGEAVSLLIDQAQGNPLFSQELALAWLHSGRVLRQGGAASLRGDRSFAGALGPTTLRALIKSRVDRLGDAALFTLKLASVLGLSFERDWLLPLLPEAADPDALRPSLDTLAEDGCLLVERGGENPRFAFSHALIQAVTYDLLSEAQRRSLHARAGLELERLHAADLAPVLGRLSHHFNESGNTAKATLYSGLAGRQALEAYANDDAIHLFERALEGDESVRGKQAIDLQRARWLAGIAQASYSLARPTAAREAYRRALQMAGHREPRGALPVLRGLLRLLVRGTSGRGPVGTHSEAEKSLDQLVLSLLLESGTLDVWQGRLLGSAAKAFVGHRLAEGSGPSGNAAEVIASFGYLLGVTPLRAIGEAELRRAIAIADRSGDLQAIASTRVMLGMYHTMVGAPREALPIVEQAQPAAERLGAGLWKHRTRFMLGEPLLSLGRFGDAARAFREAALLSRGADPPVVGLANAFAALADLRQGAVEAALALVDGPSGAVLCDGSAARMQRFTVLGLQAEIRLGADRIEEAWESALCAEDAYGWPCDVFFAAFHAHAALCDVYLRLWWWVGEGRLPTTFPADQRALARRAVRAWRRLRRFALLYPGARPATDYWGARVAAMLSRRRRAARLAGRSLLRARAMGLPVEERLARSLLERGYAPEPAAAAASEPGFLPPSTSEAIDDHRVDNRIHPTV